MSKVGLFSVKDVKVAEFGVVIQHKTDAEAVRSLTTFVNSGADHVMAQHPSDFVLYCVGSIDTESGIISPETTPRHIVDVITLINPS